MMHLNRDWIRQTNIEPIRKELERILSEMRLKNDEKGKDPTDTAFLRGQIAMAKELLTAFTRKPSAPPPGGHQYPDLME